MGSEQPDVITMQEVWENNYKKKIRDDLAKEYPYSHLDLASTSENLVEGAVKGEFVYLNSGLMILSKYPIHDKCRTVFEASVGAENKMAAKGGLGVTLKMPDDSFAHVFTTHLQAQRTDAANDMKIEHLKQMKRMIRDHTKHNAWPIILTGDFNLSDAKNPDVIARARALFSDSDEYPDFVDTYNQSRATSKEDRVLTASTWDSVNQYKSDPSSGDKNGYHKIDHVWLLTNKAEGYSYATEYFGEDLSDHLAERAVFNLLNPNKAVNDLIESLRPKVNKEVPAVLKDENLDPMHKVASGNDKLGKTKIAKGVKAQVKAGYSIKEMKGLSSLQITLLEVDVVNVESDEVTGTARIQGRLTSDLTAKVSGSMKASACGISVKESISGSVTAKQVTCDAGGSFDLTLAIRGSSLDDFDVTGLTLNYKDIDVRIKGLGKFNKYMGSLVDEIANLFKGTIKGEVTKHVKRELDQAFQQIVPIYTDGYVASGLSRELTFDAIRPKKRSVWGLK